jgi:hypothetical protein
MLKADCFKRRLQNICEIVITLSVIITKLILKLYCLESETNQVHVRNEARNV